MLPNDWTQILGGFPPVDFAFTYGSGAIQQGGYNYQRKPSELPMLDLIFIVENSETWHSENLKMNPTHYTSLFPMNAQSIAFVQDKIPAHFWFNAYVPVKGGNMSGRLMKYGVISRKHAIRDLTSWNDFYIAGRLQKPVNVLQSNSTVDSAILENRLMAIKTALLLLPETFSEVDLYSTVVSLSYMGDPRMFVGENPNKVRNLVIPVVNQYRSLYLPSIESISKDASLSHSHSHTIFHQSTRPSVRWGLCSQLPLTLRTILTLKARDRLARSAPPNASTIRMALASVIARSASMQTIKGLFTVGLAKSSSYLVAKMAKRFLSPA